jgi:hypothetical protein
MKRNSVYAIEVEQFEGFMPQFPLMLCDEDHGVEWEHLDMIAERTDQPQDWEAVAQYEAACDHMVFEGRWNYASVV